MKKNKAFRYRIYPTKEQEILFQKTFGCCRFIWNKMLSDKIVCYNETNQMVNNTPAPYKQEFEWLKEVDSLALANVQLQLQTAFKKFFKEKKIGFPKFKSKKCPKKSYTTNNLKGTIRIIDDSHLAIPKMKSLKIKLHRPIPESYKIKSATISQHASGRFYISILTEYEWEKPIVNLSKEKSLGLDYSSPEFYVDSQGMKADYPRFFRLSQDSLAKEQLKLSHMKAHSKNYERQKIKVARLHEHIANQRKDFIHQLSYKLSNEYDYICVEALNLHAMAQGLNLGKSTNDNGFGMFRTIINYKMQDRGKQLITINKWFPSSKTCHVCGLVKEDLKLGDREWACEGCGEHHLRDVNAAINIMNFGLLEVS